MKHRSGIPKAPLHPLSSLVTIALDSLFGASEVVLPFSLPVTMAVVFCAGTISVTLIERYLARCPWGPSIAKGFAMGVLAGLPYPVMGTGAGVLFLGWSGLSGVSRLLNPPDKY